MTRYSPFVDDLLSGRDLLKRLVADPSASVPLLLKVREAKDNDLAPDTATGEMFPLIRAALLYLCEGNEESHRIVQDRSDDTSAYLHGMIHRREPDFENARYWFRRAGTHPMFGALHAEASRVSADMAKQQDWDPYLFTGLCEQDRFGAAENHEQLVQLQRLEFDRLFDYIWRQSVG
jgi:hypothetical protein